MQTTHRTVHCVNDLRTVHCVNDLIQKKSNGIDSTQSNGYYKDNVVGGFETREEAALWDIAKQGADVLGSHDYGTVPDATAPRQAQKAVFEET